MGLHSVVLIAYLLITYLICGIPFGKLVAQAQGVNIQQVGSGNIGTTNVAREVGKGAAAATLAFDAGKGILVTALATWLFPIFVTDGASVASTEPHAWLIGLVMIAAIWGHVFSPFLGFHGGKGIAVGVGTLLGFAWPLGLIELGIFLVLALITRRVSVGSVVVAAVLPVIAGVWGGWNWPLVITLAIAGWTVVWAHRSNISKLMHGEEPPFSFHGHDSPSPSEGGTAV